METTEQKFERDLFNTWQDDLTRIIKHQACISEDEIALPRNIKDLYLDGKTPEQVFFDVWQQDAGNYYKIDF